MKGQQQQLPGASRGVWGRSHRRIQGRWREIEARMAHTGTPPCPLIVINITRPGNPLIKPPFAYTRRFGPPCGTEHSQVWSMQAGDSSKMDLLLRDTLDESQCKKVVTYCPVDAIEAGGFSWANIADRGQDSPCGRVVSENCMPNCTYCTSWTKITAMSRRCSSATADRGSNGSNGVHKMGGEDGGCRGPVAGWAEGSPRQAFAKVRSNMRVRAAYSGFVQDRTLERLPTSFVPAIRSVSRAASSPKSVCR